MWSRGAIRGRLLCLHSTFIALHYGSYGLFISVRLHFILCVSFPYSFSIFFQIVSHMHLFIDPSKCSFGVITAQHPSESQRRLAGTAKLMWPQVRLSHKSIPLTASHMQEDGASWVQKNIMSANVSLWQH